MAKRKKNADPTESLPSASGGKNKQLGNSDASFKGITRPLSLVAQVEQTLRAAINDDVFPQGRLPTLIDLAEQLRVSRETVRLALDSLQSEGLIVKRRRRGTFVNAPSVPKALKSPKRKILGYLFEEYDFGGAGGEVISRPHGSAMLEGAILEAGKHGYQLVTSSAKPYQLREEFDRMNELGPLTGTIFVCVGEEKLLKSLSGRGMPAVLLDHEMHLPKVGSVRGDSQQNAQLAIKHLASLGHRNIACAHWRQSDLNPWFLRGYRQGMHGEGLRCRRIWEMYVELNQRGATETLNNIMKLPHVPTAIVCFHNTFASQLITAAWQAGYRIPDDLSVVGCGGEEIVNLTCTQLDWNQLGRTAVQILLKSIESSEGHEAEHILIPYKLNIGGTTSDMNSGK